MNVLRIVTGSFYSFKNFNLLDINKIYNENCLDTMKRMPDNFIDLTVTSPPYDNLRNYNGYTFDFEPIAKELFRVTKEGGVVVWVVGDATINGSETGTSFEQALYFKKYCGFNIHDTMIYQKNKAPINAQRYQCQFEYMFVFSKRKVKTFNPIKIESVRKGTKLTSSQRDKNGKIKPRGNGKSYVKEKKIKPNVWFYYAGNGEGDKIAENHSARFPESLAADHIKSWSNEGDLIYDPFMGSGTTAKMAHLLKRNWVGSEISKEYTELAYKRIDPYLRQLSIF